MADVVELADTADWHSAGPYAHNAHAVEGSSPSIGTNPCNWQASTSRPYVAAQ